MKHIYSAAKQISAAVSPDNAANSFRECVVIRHPRSGEYALAFITGQTTLVHADGREEELFSVFHCTNHVYLGDIYLLPAKDIIRSNLTGITAQARAHLVSKHRARCSPRSRFPGT